MNKNTVLSITCSLFGLLLVLMLVVFFDSYQKDADLNKGASYKDSHTYSYVMEESVRLDSHEDQEGAPYSWYAGFSWIGALEVALESVEIYQKDDFNIKAGLQEKMLVDGLSEWSDSMKLLVATLRIRNVDAQPLADDDQSFMSSIFRMPDSISYEPAYVDLGEASLSNSTGKDFYRFYVAPDEEETIKVGWFVDDETIANGTNFIVGATGTEKYIFEIPSESRKEE